MTSATNEPLWLTEADVVALMDLSDAIAALEQGLAMEGGGQAKNMDKTHLAWGHNNLHAIGGGLFGAGLVGTKTWAHTEGGTGPLLILFDAANGSLQAIIEAFALGQMRTAGVSGVATDRLARREASELAIIGTGKQALPQVAAVAAVRALKRVRVYSPRPVSRDAFAAKVRDGLDLDAVAMPTIEEAVRDAPMVTLVTRATTPFLTAGMLARGTHVNAVGAIAPDREEFAQDVFARCDRMVVDNVGTVRELSREFRAQFGEAGDRWQGVQTLSALLASDERRPPNADLTLFKAMGMGISDLAVGAEVLRRARAQGVGRSIAPVQKVAPRLRKKQ